MKPETFAPSEIANFVYCPEAWRLAQVGTRPTIVIQAARAQGTRHHVSLTVTETAATTSIKRSRRLVAVGVAVLILALLWAFLRWSGSSPWPSC